MRPPRSDAGSRGTRRWPPSFVPRADRRPRSFLHLRHLSAPGRNPLALHRAHPRRRARGPAPAARVPVPIRGRADPDRTDRDRDYVVEEERVLDPRNPRPVVSWWRYRGDPSGLFMADLPGDLPPGGGAGADLVKSSSGVVLSALARMADGLVHVSFSRGCALRRASQRCGGSAPGPRFVRRQPAIRGPAAFRRARSRGSAIRCAPDKAGSFASTRRCGRGSRQTRCSSFRPAASRAAGSESSRSCSACAMRCTCGTTKLGCSASRLTWNSRASISRQPHPRRERLRPEPRRVRLGACRRRLLSRRVRVERPPRWKRRARGAT